MLLSKQNVKKTKMYGILCKVMSSREAKKQLELVRDHHNSRGISEGTYSLAAAFVWDKTPQGIQYWRRINIATADYQGYKP